MTCGSGRLWKWGRKVPLGTQKPRSRHWHRAVLSWEAPPRPSLETHFFIPPSVLCSPRGILHTDNSRWPSHRRDSTAVCPSSAAIRESGVFNVFVLGWWQTTTHRNQNTKMATSGTQLRQNGSLSHTQVTSTGAQRGSYEWLRGNDVPSTSRVQMALGWGCGTRKKHGRLWGESRIQDEV